MKQFVSFIKKEMLHIVRDIRTMLLLIAMPIIQLLIFGYAISNEITNTPVVVLDHSRSVTSIQLINKIANSKYFDLRVNANAQNEVEEAFQKGHVKLALIIPSSFNNDLQHSGIADIQLLADASDPNEASNIISYAQQIIMQYQQGFQVNKTPYQIRPEVKMLYNPQLKSAYNFVPGIMGMVLMLICAMMTSLSIVREKEQGTMEILLVSPIKPIFIVLAKAIPYLIISMLDVALILTLSYFVLDVPIVGSLALIIFLSLSFTLAALSLGMMISSVANTQQVAMMVSGVGLMLPTMLLSGLVFPLENMPFILRTISNIVPAKWFTLAIKDVMIKGLGFFSIWKEVSILIFMTVFLLFMSVKQFKNRL